MYMISASQIRAARGLLNWTQDYLADIARVSRGTVNTIEKGEPVNVNKVKAVRGALEMHGIEFLPDDGVKRHPDGPRDFMGPDSCDQLFDDVLQTLKERGGGLICMIDSHTMLTKVSGSTRRSNLQRLQQIQELADVKCLLMSENIPQTFDLPTFQIRVFPDAPSLFSSSAFIYGNKLVIGYRDKANLHFAFLTLPMAHFVESSTNYFAKRWPIAKQILSAEKSKKLCA